MPTLTIFAGINGAGKSTLYNFIKSSKHYDLGKRICPDEILQDFNGDWTDQTHQIKSGLLALRQIRHCLKHNKSFNWETTVLGPTALKIIKQAKQQGYKVNLNFIGVQNVEQSLERIQKRVDEGGHGINDNVVKKRYNRQFDNIKEVCQQIDNTIFYDNTKNMQIVATYSNQSLLVFGSVPWVCELDVLKDRTRPLINFKLNNIFREKK